MILPDVNVLVYAFRREAVDHDRYASWLSAALVGSELALAEGVLLGMIRIVTSPRIMADPAPTRIAIRFVDALLAAPRARPLASNRGNVGAVSDHRGARRAGARPARPRRVARCARPGARLPPGDGRPGLRALRRPRLVRSRRARRRTLTTRSISIPADPRGVTARCVCRPRDVDRVQGHPGRLRRCARCRSVRYGMTISSSARTRCSTSSRTACRWSFSRLAIQLHEATWARKPIGSRVWGINVHLVTVAAAAGRQCISMTAPSGTPGQRRPATARDAETFRDADATRLFRT